MIYLEKILYHWSKNFKDIKYIKTFYLFKKKPKSKHFFFNSYFLEEKIFFWSDFDNTMSYFNISDDKLILKNNYSISKSDFLKFKTRFEQRLKSSIDLYLLNNKNKTEQDYFGIVGSEKKKSFEEKHHILYEEDLLFLNKKYLNSSLHISKKTETFIDSYFSAENICNLIQEKINKRKNIL